MYENSNAVECQSRVFFFRQRKCATKCARKEKSAQNFAVCAKFFVVKMAKAKLLAKFPIPYIVADLGKISGKGAKGNFFENFLCRKSRF